MQQKVLFFYPNESSFVNKDIEILKEKFIVKPFLFNNSQPKLLFFEFLKQFFFLLRNINGNVSACSMFSGYHSLLPALFFKFFNKKITIIAGGTDCCSLPSINYGNFRKPILGWFTKKSFQLSSQILPVHKSLIFQEDNYYGIDGKYQGITHFIKNLNAKLIAVNNAYDSSFFKKLDNSEREPKSFITIGSKFNSETLLKLKGIDLIIHVSEKFPDCSFYILGDLNSPKNYPKNIIFLPSMNQKEMVKVLNSKEFYLQLSIREGFPNALAEAMLCGCIPIGSSISAIPEIIGDTGFILQKRDINLLEETIQIALKSNKPELSIKARNRIIENYPLQKRKKELLELI